VAVLTAVWVGLIAPPALAAFPYPPPPSGTDPYSYEDYMFLKDATDNRQSGGPASRVF
jgi:hypothetical protein